MAQGKEIKKIDIIDDSPGDECCSFPCVILKVCQHPALSKKERLERDAPSHEQDNRKSKKNQFEADIELHLTLISASTNFRAFSNCTTEGPGNWSNFVVSSNSFSALLPSCD